jgi:hypothetical protein
MDGGLVTGLCQLAAPNNRRIRRGGSSPGDPQPILLLLIKLHDPFWSSCSDYRMTRQEPIRTLTESVEMSALQAYDSPDIDLSCLTGDDVHMRGPYVPSGSSSYEMSLY